MRTASRRSMTEIENEIGRTRVELDLTLDTLAVELAPKHLVEKAANMVKRSGSATRRSGMGLGGAFRADPAPLALIGLGLAWLVAENTGLFGGAAAGRGECHAATDPVGGGSAFECAGEHTEEITHPGGRACRAGRRLTDVIARNPLLFGLAGIVSGAAVAVLLPSARREREMVAQAREDLWEKAEELGHRAADSIRAMARTSRGAADEG
jgi:Protein of unknown function (DUF3618)